MNRILSLLLLFAATTANAAVSIAESTVVTLLRGTSSQGTFPSWDACRDRALALAQADTRTTGSVTYACQAEKRQFVATYTANPPPPPACGPQPTAETQTVQCPAGTTGTWVQTRTFVSAPAPTCW